MFLLICIPLSKKCMTEIHFTNSVHAPFLDSQWSDFIDPQEHQSNPNQEKNSTEWEARNQFFSYVLLDITRSSMSLRKTVCTCFVIWNAAHWRIQKTLLIALSSFLSFNPIHQMSVIWNWTSGISKLPKPRTVYFLSPNPHFRSALIIN